MTHHRILRILVAILGAGIAAYVILFLVVLYAQYHVPGPQSGYEAIIVLGAQVKRDGTPSVQLQWRLDAAGASYTDSHVPIVVCGAQGKDEPATEASVMKAYLMKFGIPEEDILMDDQSFSTDENIRNARALLPGTDRVLIVTSDYHLPRSLMIARDAGFDACGLGSPTLGGFYWLKNHARETLSWVKYFLVHKLGIPIG